MNTVTMPTFNIVANAEEKQAKADAEAKDNAKEREERDAKKKVKTRMEYLNLWNYYKIYGNSWSVISRECTQSKITNKALQQKFISPQLKE
jgi:hypothetical protein